jgi:hypothetical protein
MVAFGYSLLCEQRGPRELVSDAVEAVRPFVEAGFTHVALVQVGGDTQPDYLTFAERELLPALREEYGKPDAQAIRVR